MAALAGQQKQPLPLPQPSFHQHNVWVPANPYLTEEIPNWLFIYSRAPVELDHQLKVITNTLIISVCLLIKTTNSWLNLYFSLNYLAFLN